MSDTPEQIQFAPARRSAGGGTTGPSRDSAIGVNPLVYPLDEFYAQTGQSLPPIEAVDGSAVPEPYRSLLVHNKDMTPTLEEYWGAKVHLWILRRQHRDDFYFRQVVLLLDGSDQPVEYGAIKINLALFPAAARRDILEERIPLGHVLAAHQIAHSSRPKAYLRIEADAHICKALNLTGSQSLFGRRNTLADVVQRPLAEIIEILPPVAKPA